MKYKFILSILFIFIVPVNAKKSLQIKTMNQVFEGIGHSTRDISAFAKSIMELDSSKQELDVSLKLDLPAKCIGSNNDDENIGKYLNKITDEELRARIEKDYITEGKNLLNDFFDTIAYKTLQKKFKKFIEAMTACSFLTSDESKKIRNLKIFYPNDYECSQYSWKRVSKDNKLSALNGTFSKSIGLKGCNDPSKDDFFMVTVYFDYECTMGELSNHVLKLRCKQIQSMDKSVPIELFSEPKHGMCACILFMRQKFEGMYSYALYTCNVGCEQRTYPKNFNNELEKQDSKSSDFADIGFGSTESFLTNENIDLDPNCVIPPCPILESFKINRGLVNPIYNDLTTIDLDFVIKTHQKTL